MTNRYICIHGHFYQPPRENPWLDEVELRDSAFPYHDWNSRIAAECYAPLTSSRILGPDRKIIDLVNTYSKISFNFGPTLLSWMEQHEPETYQAILHADKESQRKFSGHGSSIAQAYNHIIMPLATNRDKRTQVIWGINDFEHRFGRKPEGMWLPETAVDLETLDILAEFGIRFTILAPRQAKRVRKLKDERWKEVNESTIDPKMPYLCKLPSGRFISLFFYEGPISHEVAFGGLLENGEYFAKRLIEGFEEKLEKPQLVHVAADGETYGHHHRFGDMALAYCVYYLESNNLATMTAYGEYLEKYPPTYEVEILENSSWSCMHGVERWKANCGCNSGTHQGWTQQWRTPLRGAMDWLRDNLEHIYKEQVAELVGDPWKVRDDYIDVILDRSPQNVEKFLSAHAVRELSQEDKVRVLKLLEMQRHAMLMYTSCGWFFDEISGIEAVQVIRYAARAMQLAKETSGVSLEETYINLLERAPSNLPEFKNGAGVYDTLVRPIVLDLLRVGAHYAVSSLFEDYSETVRLYSYTVSRQTYDLMEVGKQKLAIGRAMICSDITWEEDTISFAVLHLGDQNIIAGVRRYEGKEAFDNMQQEIRDAVTRNDVSEVIRLVDKHFGAPSYSLWHLFKDEQRKVLNQIFDHAQEEMWISFRKIYQDYYSIMQVVSEIRMPLAKPFSAVAEFVLNMEIKMLLESEKFNLDQLQKIVEEVKRRSLNLDSTTFGFVGSQRITAIMEEFLHSPEDVSLLERIVGILKAVSILSLDLNLWKVENMYFSIGKRLLGEMKKRYEKGDETARRWVEHFDVLGEYLKIRIG